MVLTSGLATAAPFHERSWAPKAILIFFLLLLQFLFLRLKRRDSTFQLVSTSICTQLTKYQYPLTQGLKLSYSHENTNHPKGYKQQVVVWSERKTSRSSMIVCLLSSLEPEVRELRAFHVPLRDNYRLAKIFCRVEKIIVISCCSHSKTLSSEAK